MDETTLAAHAVIILGICQIVKKNLPLWTAGGWLPKRYQWLVPLGVSAAAAGVEYYGMDKTWQEALTYGVTGWLAAMGAHAVGKQQKQNRGDELNSSSGFLPPSASGIVLALGLALGGCQQLQVPDWPEVVECGPDVSDLVSVVSRVLLGQGDVVSELTQLAGTHGYDTVACLVDQLRSDWTESGAAASPERARGVQRAGAFLAEVGTRVER